MGHLSLILILVMAVATPCLRAASNSIADSISFESIAHACENGLDFGSIKDFKKFLNVFGKEGEEKLKEGNIPKPCIRDRQAILDLDKIISTTEICDPVKIDDLIEYHKSYLRPRKFHPSKKTITNRFFTKYAIQVAYVCKSNLIRNLEIARDELGSISKTFEEAKEKIYKEEPSIKSNIRLIEDQPDVPTSTNAKPQDDAELTLSEYREALTALRRPEDILTFDRGDCAKSRSRDTIVSSDKVQTFFKPAIMCHQLHRYYAGSVLSIARLANLGYIALDEELDAKLEEDPRVRDWVIAVQVCDPMLFMSAKEVRGDFTVIDTCSPKVNAIEIQVYADNFEDLDMDKLKDMLPKSEATRRHAQKLMKSALKKMAKVDLMKQLRSGASKKSIFAKSLAMFKTRDAGSDFTSDPASRAVSMNRFSIRLSDDMSSLAGIGGEFVEKEMSDEESYELLRSVSESESAMVSVAIEKNDIDSAVSFFDPMSTLVTSLTVMAIMLSFEWLFFIVMTLAARLCTHLYFNFENLLTFPPKFLSWSDADFAKFTDTMEKYDEDDFFDYEELTPDEKQQRDKLSKVFGRPPPMLFRD